MAETLVAAFAATAASEPGAPAIIEKRFGKWVIRDRGDVSNESAAMAAGLQSIGVSPGDTVALMVSARTAWVTLDLGIQAIGARSFAIPRVATTDDIAHLIDRSGARTVVVEGQDEADVILTAIEGGRLDAVTHIVYIDPAGVSEYASELLHGLSDLDADGPSLTERASALDPASAAVLVPDHSLTDIIELSHGTVAQAARSTVEAFSLNAKDRVVAARNMADPVERGATIYAALLSGALLALPESVATTDAAIHEIAPTYLHVTERWLTKNAAGITVRFDENRGLKSRLAKSWRKRTGSTLEHYGSGKRPRGIWRLTVSIPVLEEFGLEKARAVVVSGDPAPQELLGFYTALGLPVKAALALPALAGFATVGDPGDADGWVGGAAPNVTVAVEGGTLIVSTDTTGRLDTGLTAEAGADGFIVNGGSSEEAAETRLRSIPVFATAMVSPGAEVVTIELDGEIASRWASRNHLDAATYRSFSQLPEMVAGIEAAVAGTLEHFGLAHGSIVVLEAPLHETPGALSFGEVARRSVVA